MLSHSIVHLFFLSVLVPAVLAAPHLQDKRGSLSRRAPACQIKCYDNGIDAFYYDNNSINQATNTLCSAQCHKRPRCVGFGFGKKVRMLFNVLLRHSGLANTLTAAFSAGNVDEEASSGFPYYDAACASSTTSKSSTKSSTSASSSSPSSSSATTSAVSTSVTASTSITKTSSTTSSGALSSGSAVMPPTNCPIPVSWTVSYFNWFNSTHNLDFVTGPDLGDGTICLNSSSNGQTVTCDPSQGPCQTCGVPACYAGLPLQPPGYGPPDNVTITIDGFRTCTQTNPYYETGGGYVNCDSAAYFLNFYGSTNVQQGIGILDFHPPATACKDGKTPLQPVDTAEFSYSCTYDAGRNATCTAPPFEIPLTSFTTYTKS